MAFSWRRLARDFRREINEDHIGQGAAALAFYWMLALFPAAIFLLTLLAYLPIPHLERALLHFARSTLPDDAGALLSSFVDTVLRQKRGGLLSFGALLTVWSTSSGIHALMHQLNVAWDVDERRPFWKRRAVALLIAMCFVLLVIAAFGLVVFGRALHLRLLRWLVVCAALLVGIALIYHYGPNVKRRFRLVTPGSLLALAMLIVASVGFQVFVTRVGRFNITYGSLGAAITLMLWLYLAAWAILLGAELDATLSAYARPKAT
jgi:membrane protein